MGRKARKNFLSCIMEDGIYLKILFPPSSPRPVFAKPLWRSRQSGDPERERKTWTPAFAGEKEWFVGMKGEAEEINF
jgi:hypothetical protein